MRHFDIHRKIVGDKIQEDAVIIRTTVSFVEAVATIVIMVTHPRSRYTAMARWTLDHVGRTVAL